MNVYFISGIGADYRFFTHVRLPQGYEARYIHWIPPVRNEPLASYAFRLTTQIDTTEPFVLIGLSLGGIMAVEIAKRIPAVCTILISSVPLSAHMPPLYRLAGALKLGRLIPATPLKLAAIIKHNLTMPGVQNRRLIRQVIRDGENRFIRWALSAVLDWRNDILPQPLFHLHGTRDEVFPFRRTHPTHIIPGNGHMFLINHPETVNQILREILPPIQNRTTAGSKSDG
jgi:pimeloyl-ACP methyl ester carboxylesterase